MAGRVRRKLQGNQGVARFPSGQMYGRLPDPVTGMRTLDLVSASTHKREVAERERGEWRGKDRGIPRPGGGRVGLSANLPANGQRGKSRKFNPFEAKVGGQLARRVASGEISQEQAERTARERAELAQAFGPNWRTKVFGDRGYMRRTRGQLAGGADDTQVGALNTQLLKRRQAMLKRARLMRNGGTAAPGN